MQDKKHDLLKWCRPKKNKKKTNKKKERFSPKKKPQQIFKIIPNLLAGANRWKSIMLKFAIKLKKPHSRLISGTFCSKN